MAGCPQPPERTTALEGGRTAALTQAEQLPIALQAGSSDIAKAQVPVAVGWFLEERKSNTQRSGSSAARGRAAQRTREAAWEQTCPEAALFTSSLSFSDINLSLHLYVCREFSNIGANTDATEEVRDASGNAETSRSSQVLALQSGTSQGGLGERPKVGCSPTGIYSRISASAKTGTQGKHWGTSSRASRQGGFACLLHTGSMVAPLPIRSSLPPHPSGLH